MSRWLKLDTSWHRNPKMIKAGVIGELVYLRSLAYAADHLTDGFIPREAVRAIFAELEERGIWRMLCREPVANLSHRHGVTTSVTPQSRREDEVKLSEPSQATVNRRRQRVESGLVAAGLWVKESEGYRIHDYLKHQSSASEMRTKEEQTREQARLRKQRERERKKASSGHANGSQSRRISEGVTPTRKEGLSTSYLNQKKENVTPPLGAVTSSYENSLDLLTEDERELARLDREYEQVLAILNSGTEHP